MHMGPNMSKGARVTTDDDIPHRLTQLAAEITGVPAHALKRAVLVAAVCAPMDHELCGRRLAMTGTPEEAVREMATAIPLVRGVPRAYVQSELRAALLYLARTDPVGSLNLFYNIMDDLFVRIQPNAST